MPQENLIYLGDSVYCEYEYDIYSYVIFTNNGERGLANRILRKNEIYLEPEVLDALIRFYTKTQQNRKETE